MPVELERVYESVMQLSATDRGLLVTRLLESIENDDSSEQELRAIIQQRMDELDSGKVEAIPAEVVFQKIKELLA